jgi:predicted ester cyclase
MFPFAQESSYGNLLKNTSANVSSSFLTFSQEVSGTICGITQTNAQIKFLDNHLDSLINSLKGKTIFTKSSQKCKTP